LVIRPVISVSSVQRIRPLWRTLLSLGPFVRVAYLIFQVRDFRVLFRDFFVQFFDFVVVAAGIARRTAVVPCLWRLEPSRHVIDRRRDNRLAVTPGHRDTTSVRASAEDNSLSITNINLARLARWDLVGFTFEPDKGVSQIPR